MGGDTVDLLDEAGPGFGAREVEKGKAAVICCDDGSRTPGECNQMDDAALAP